jgi:precorrin-6B methylase 2
MTRPAGFDLASELAKPSFTPGARDAHALVALIVAGDEPTATRAAPAVARLGDAGRTAVEGMLAELDGTGQAADATSARDGSGGDAEARAAGGAPAKRAKSAGEEDGAQAARGEGATADRAKPRAARGGDRGRAKPAKDDDGARARLIGVLGLLARGGDERARMQVIARTGDRAVRVRKAAVIALGKLGGDEARQALIARWDTADAAPEERRALAEALGKVGGDDALVRLRALGASDDGELMRRRDRAILMADRTAKRDEVSRIVDDVAPPAPVAIELGCRPGLGALLVEELAALGIAAQLIGDRGAALRLERPLGSLFAARLWATMAIRVPLAAGRDLASAITATIAARSTVSLLRAWTRGPIRWRLGFASGHKRAIVWRVARDVTAAVPALINDPTSTTWDIIVDSDGKRDEMEHAVLALVPRRLDDPRFGYRVADVPAASHPTVAAALVWLSEPSADDRVWDPFCGSAVELVECARRAPVRSLVGTDLDAGALEAARENLEAAGVDAQLVQGDARSDAPGPVDLILSNPPLGSRVQIDAVALLVAALPNLVRALAPRGRLVWITPSTRKTSPVAEQLGLVRTRSYAVDLGGVRGQLERWDRR